MANIIIKKSNNSFHPHFNRALGKRYHTKEDYFKDMKDGGFIPQKEADAIAEQRNKDNRKEYKASPELRQFINGVKNSADSEGNVKLSDRQIDFMKEKGVSLEAPKALPTEGGFE